MADRGEPGLGDVPLAGEGISQDSVRLKEPKQMDMKADEMPDKIELAEAKQVMVLEPATKKGLNVDSLCKLVYAEKRAKVLRQKQQEDVKRQYE